MVEHTGEQVVAHDARMLVEVSHPSTFKIVRKVSVRIRQAQQKASWIFTEESVDDARVGIARELVRHFMWKVRTVRSDKGDCCRSVSSRFPLVGQHLVCNGYVQSARLYDALADRNVISIPRHRAFVTFKCSSASSYWSFAFCS